MTPQRAAARLSTSRLHCGLAQGSLQYCWAPLSSLRCRHALQAARYRRCRSTLPCQKHRPRLSCSSCASVGLAGDLSLPHQCIASAMLVALSPAHRVSQTCALASYVVTRSKSVCWPYYQGWWVHRVHVQVVRAYPLACLQLQAAVVGIDGHVDGGRRVLLFWERCAQAFLYLVGVVPTAGRWGESTQGSCRSMSPSTSSQAATLCEIFACALRSSGCSIVHSVRLEVLRIRGTALPDLSEIPYWLSGSVEPVSKGLKWL
jgi:hypothetical protein